jgi:hypothetical protein
MGAYLPPIDILSTVRYGSRHYQKDPMLPLWLSFALVIAYRENQPPVSDRDPQTLFHYAVAFPYQEFAPLRQIQPHLQC